MLGQSAFTRGSSSTADSRIFIYEVASLQQNARDGDVPGASPIRPGRAKRQRQRAHAHDHERAPPQ